MTPALYFCNFPPLNSGGGGLLMRHILGDYPADLLTVLTGSYHCHRVSKEELQSAGDNYFIFPVTAATGRWGTGRVLVFLNWLALPLLVLIGIYLVKRKQVRVILSIAHDYFFIAAAVLSRLSELPLVLWVHDDWIAHTRQNSYILKYFAAPIFSYAVRSARHVYAISAPMAGWLRSEYGIEAEVQMPCSEGIAAPGERNPAIGEAFRIAFAGTNVGTGDTLGILAGLLAAGASLADGRRIELHLYMPAPGFRPEWRHQNVILHSWVPQAELLKELRLADLLFLPYNFSESYERLWSRSFPTKAAEYLRYGQPILVMAPARAAIVPYARAHGFAEVIDQPDRDALLDAIRRIAADASYRERLSARALETFQKNHDAARQRREVYRLINQLGKERTAARASRTESPRRPVVKPGEETVAASPAGRDGGNE